MADGNLLRMRPHPTLCSKCRHVVYREPEDSPRREVWYAMRCGAVGRERALDVVTGRSVYLERNDFGQEVATDEPHPACREINSGACPHWEAGPPTRAEEE